MRATTAKVYRDYWMARSISGFLLVVGIGFGLMAVKVKGLEKIKAPKDVKGPASTSWEDVLSPADVRQWRQEFLWHRNIPKFCANRWIEDKECARITQRL